MFRALLAGALLLASSWQAEAAGVDTSALQRLAQDKDPLAEAAALVEAGDFERAVPKLEAIVEHRPDDADAQNYLAYSLHKIGRHDDARHHYDLALAIDPDHLGALEYLGELHVALGEIEAAEALLERLDTLCPEGCEERDDLAEAIAHHRNAGALN